MAEKEATARIKINKLLEAAGWRFFASSGAPANVCLESSVTLKTNDLDALGDNFEKTGKGFIDFLLLDAQGFPFIVLEAKSEEKNPLVGKEQARKYAKAHNCRFVILSNGNLHYFWDLERGNPYIITSFPTPESVTGFQRVTPNPQRLIDEQVKDDYIVLTQRPNYQSEAAWRNEAERPAYIQTNKLRFLRPYQLKAIEALQRAVKDGKDRFLFEMATGTGKTLTAAAVIKLFLRSGNASRVLFLVDRLELEDQATKAFIAVLSADFKTVIYKESRDEWRHAEIVVTTVQALLFNNKYQKLFSPTDFDLVISDEAHRSIGGNARAVFDYFVGYKLGLTATPRDYLKRFDQTKRTTRDPREAERRLLLDTYRTFGCENSLPTFRYSLLDGVKEGYLINPVVVDARTEVTTELLSEEGFVVSYTDDSGEDQDEAYKQREFEKRFFSDATNQLFCKTLLENTLRDPVSGEIGKSIIFAVSQNHAAKLAQILNEMADRMFPGKYQSDFAVQVTSAIPGAQQMTINFTNNNLLGSANVLPAYKTSKARVCVTVGMMTTGYDCPDILNLGLFRPIFSPTDFIQIKGRGTRKHDFRDQLFDDSLKPDIAHPQKTAFKLFDFFANCEYFEEEFNYDEVLKLPKPKSRGKGGDDTGGPVEPGTPYEHLGSDIIASMRVEQITADGMKIDRMFFEKFEDTVRDNETIAKAIEAGQWDQVIDYVNREVFDKPTEFYSLDKLRKAAAVDRRLTLREILAFHLLYMSFVSFSIWQIRRVRENEFRHALIGFQSETENELLEAVTPFKFYDRLKESQIFRFLKVIGCRNDQVGEFAKFVKRRNKIAHPSGTVFFNDQRTIDDEIAEMMKEVVNIQTHMRPVILDVYGNFLRESANPEEREYGTSAEEIEVNLIHRNYISQRDIDICLGCDLALLADSPNYADIQALHQCLRDEYAEPELATAVP